MHTIITLLIALILLPFTTQALNPSWHTSLPGISHYNSSSDFSDHPYLTKTIRKKVKPFLLPPTHPAKAALDAIFSASRASESDVALKAAGFKILFKQPRSFIRVVSHDLLPGYLLKLVPDRVNKKKFGKPEWEWFVGRCAQAQRIDRVIQSNKIKNFIVAKKWLYSLPATPEPMDPNVSRHDIILVATYMDLVSVEENYAAWKTLITPQHLDELYIIMSKAKGTTYRPDNMPLTKSGYFAFIDTEFKKDRNTNFTTIREYLSEEMQAYWDSLTQGK